MTLPASEWNPFPLDNVIGDPGHQPEIRARSGALDVNQPDTSLDFFTVDSFEVRGCSTRGWSHRYNGRPRQDSHAVLVDDHVLVVAVADGVSEGEYSQVAAETAARSACKVAADQRARNGVVDWVQLSRRISLRVVEEAEYRQISAVGGDSPTIEDRLRACLKKMATTLIVAVITREPGLDGFEVELGVVAGDSAAYLLREGRLEPLGGGKFSDSPITSNGVRPLPGPVEVDARKLRMSPGDALILGTDGLGDPLGDGAGTIATELARRWATPPTIDRFLLDVNSFIRSYDDDRTAVGVWIHPSAVLPDSIEQSADPTTGSLAGGDTLKDDTAGDVAEAPGTYPADPAAGPTRSATDLEEGN